MHTHPALSLRTVFNNFVRQQYERIKAAQVLEQALTGLPERYYANNPLALEKLCQGLGLSRQEFAEKFIAPWESLTQEQIIAASYYWNMVICPEKNLLMELSPTYEHKALQWTMVNVYELNLFPVFLDNLDDPALMRDDAISKYFLAPEFALPYNQCVYCGRLDQDPRGKDFTNKRLKLCHLEGCTSSSNIGDHPTCCYGKWRLLKNNLRLQINRCQKVPNTARAHFLNFCEKRYQANLSITNQVRVKTQKPREWRSPDDGLFSTVHADGLDTDSKGLPFFR